MKIVVEAQQTEEDPRIYNKVSITYSIKLEEKDRKNMEKAVNLSQDKYCGVSAMFRAFAEIETVINYA